MTLWQPTERPADPTVAGKSVRRPRFDLLGVGLAAILGSSLLMSVSPVPAGAAPTPQATARAAHGHHRRQALRILAEREGEIVFPPGAVEVANAPGHTGGWLGKAGGVSLTTDKVHGRGFFVVPGTVGWLRRWLEHHPPTGSSYAGGGYEHTGGKPELVSVDFSWPALRNIVHSDDVGFEMVPMRDGKVAVRWDITLTYIPPKNALDTPPAGSQEVRVLVAVPKENGDPGRLLEPTITTTDEASIARITLAINRLQVLVPGPYPCPPGPDLEVYVEMYPTPGASPDALVAAYPYGCAFVSMEVGGQTSPQLLVLGSRLAAILKHVVGMKLPPVTPGVHER